MPVSADRCISKLSQEDATKKMDRWQRIATAASKQCGRSRVPGIGPKSATVKEFCFFNRESDLKLIFWEKCKNQQKKSQKS